MELSFFCRIRRSCLLLVSFFWSWLMRFCSSLMMVWLSDRVRLRDCIRFFWLDFFFFVFCRLVDKRLMVSWRDWDLDLRFWICLFRVLMRFCRICLWNYRKKFLRRSFYKFIEKIYFLKDVLYYFYFYNMNFNV